MNNRRCFTFLAVAAALASGLGLHGAMAQDWPTRPVTMVVPFARRRRRRCHGAHPRRACSRNAGPAGGHRERRRRRRHDRRRARRQGGARRLPVRARQRRHPRPEPERSTRTRSTMRRPISRRSRWWSNSRWCWSRARICRPTTCRSSSPTPRPTRRRCNIGSAGAGSAIPSRLRAAQCGDRRQHHPRSLSRRRAGDAGSDRRPHRLPCAPLAAAGDRRRSKARRSRRSRS